MNELILTAITMMLSLMSQDLRHNITIFLNNLEADARKTSNPWDNMLVTMLRNLLDEPGT